MKDRGQDTSAFEKELPAKPAAVRAAAKGTASARRPRRRSTRCSRRCRPWSRGAARGCSWINELKPVNLRLGISDGTNTELLSGELQQNMEVVTGVTGLSTTRTTARPGRLGNPLMPEARAAAWPPARPRPLR